MHGPTPVAHKVHAMTAQSVSLVYDEERGENVGPVVVTVLEPIPLAVPLPVPLPVPLAPATSPTIMCCQHAVFQMCTTFVTIVGLIIFTVIISILPVQVR